jgi:protein-tyrosine phosphatase
MTAALSKLNFRDLGGLTAAGHRRIRRGILFRSEGPAGFLEQHRVELSALGVRSVCDLRSGVERQQAPNDWIGPACRLLNLDMNTDLRAAGANFWESLRTDPSAANARRVITRNYALMPSALLSHVAKIVGALLAHEVPMVVHCTAGKDRTGVAVAILLSLLGVSRADIVSDYARSDVFGQNMQLAGSVDEAFRRSFGFVPAQTVMALLIGADSTFLVGALQTLEHEWGSVAGYFIAGGVDLQQQEQLRRMLLE